MANGFEKIKKKKNKDWTYTENKKNIKKNDKKSRRERREARS